MADDLPLYKGFLLRFPCRVEPCVAFVVVHHHTKAPTYPPWARPAKALDGPRGKSQRASDWYGMPLCPRHHDQLHDPAKKGHFAGWTGEQLIAWQDEQIAAMHALLAEEVARNPSSPLAQLQSVPWEPPADKARERRERKRKLGKHRGRMSDAIEEFQRLAPNAFADLDGTIEQLELDRGGHDPVLVQVANRERAEAVQWLRDRAGERPWPPGLFQEVSDMIDGLAAIKDPLSMRTT